MSGFRAGKYKRDTLGVLKHFAPIQSVHALIDITPEELIEAGKKLVLVDVDNTLVEWRSDHIPESTITWLEFMKRAGLDVCIISNTRNVERLARLAGKLGIPYLVGKFKPSRSMFRRALDQFGVKPEEAIMVGDQVFTDILGANRTGIEAIWVQQMAPRDFVGTKISRLGERMLRRHLHKAIMVEDESIANDRDTGIEENSTVKSMSSGDLDENKKEKAAAPEVEEDLPVGGAAAWELLLSPVVRQFIKFCIVGGSSTVIDIGIFWILRFHATWHGELLSDAFGRYLTVNFPSIFAPLAVKTSADATVPIFKVISSTIAIFNAFIWNRRWTFKIKGKEHRSVQLKKFFVVAIIGMLLNAVITTALNSIIPGRPKMSLAVATAIATVIVAFWNFFGQKHWTFKHKH